MNSARRPGKILQRAPHAISMPAALLVALIMVGCDHQSSDLPTSALSPSSHRRDANAGSVRQPPRSLLRAIFSRYRTAASYRDQAVVRLVYRNGSELEEQTAPLSVWMDADMFYVEAYDLRLRSDGHRFLAWVVEPATEHFDSQVLTHPPLGPRPSLEAILADPLLAQRVSGGLAGPPPQLDWLLAAEPMAGLFDSDAVLTDEKDATVDGYRCRRVRVEIDDERYVFWIDPAAGVLRRVELPPIFAPVEAGQPIQEMNLQLDLNRATFDHPDELPIMSPMPLRPKFVDRFVPLPPPKPSSLLGERPSPFGADDTRQEVHFSHRGSDRPTTIYAAIGAGPLSLSTAALLQNWKRSLPESLAERIRIALLANQNVASSLPTELDLSVIIDQGEHVRDRFDLAEGALVVCNQEGVIAWIQPTLTSATLAEWGAIISDIDAGVNVPRRVLTQWKQQVKHYQRQLAQHRVDN